MIDKIKAEIESSNKWDTTEWTIGYYQALAKCLRWAEETEKELKLSLNGIIEYRIEKAFHRGESGK